MAEEKKSRQLRKELGNLLLSWWNGEEVPMMSYYQLKWKYLNSRISHYNVQYAKATYPPLNSMGNNNLT